MSTAKSKAYVVRDVHGHRIWRGFATSPSEARCMAERTYAGVSNIADPTKAWLEACEERGRDPRNVR